MKKIDAVLIDDKENIREWWSESGVKAGICCLTFSSVIEFFESLSQIPLETPIYVDSRLEDGVLGEIEAEKIFEEGFKTIYLATDVPPDELPSYILRCIGKVPPWGKDPLDDL
jgi:hypothetical protein